MSYATKALREEIGELTPKVEAALAADDNALFDKLFPILEAKTNQLRNEAFKDKTLMQTTLNNSITVRQMNEAQSLLTMSSGDELPPVKSQWQTLDGKPVHVFAKGEKLAATNLKPAVSCGEMIRCAITGRGSPEVKAAMGENQNTGGGFLVPQETGRELIDLARARSVLIAAGANTVEMQSDHLTIARVKTDPTMEVKEENLAFTGTTIAFDAVGFTAYTIGCLIYASRELAEDAPNFSQLAEQTLTRALGAELDRLGLVGSGSQEPLGISGYPTVGSTGSVGAIAWEDILTGLVGVQVANGEPNGYVVSPTIGGDLSALTSGDGSNSAKLWLGPPPGVDQLTRFTTSNMPDTTAIIGDFRQMLIGLRSRPMVEMSTVAGTAFANHQVAIKITWRGDFGLAQPTHFHVLTGITT